MPNTATSSPRGGGGDSGGGDSGGGLGCSRPPVLMGGFDFEQAGGLHAPAAGTLDTPTFSNSNNINRSYSRRMAAAGAATSSWGLGGHRRLSGEGDEAAAAAAGGGDRGRVERGLVSTSTSSNGRRRTTRTPGG